MQKPKVLIPIMLHFSIRYILRTGFLKELSEFTDPIIGISWHDDELEEEFKSLGAEIVNIPAFKFGNDFRHSRDLINIWHKNYRKTPTTSIDHRRERSLLGGKDLIYQELKYQLDLLKIWSYSDKSQMLERNEELFWSDTNEAEFEKILDEVKPDYIFSITPFVNREEPLLRVAQKRNIPMITSILSFDNVTSRTWIPVTFDHYFVWNKYNQQELLRSYPISGREKISICGPVQFDFYWDKSYFWDEADWRKRLRIPDSRPVILFGGGTNRIVPNEPLWLKEIDEDITSGKVSGNPVILFRRHPGDIAERWTPILKETKNVVVSQIWSANEKHGQTDISREDIELLVSTLAYSHVHINASSTLTVDGAIFDRPQIGGAYDPGNSKKYDRILKDLYIREHYLPITNSGGLDLVYSRNQFVSAINTALEHPELRADGRRKIVEEICTYADGKSKERLLQGLKELII
ncbi:MAG: CDP-glycerol glycerophosphotransferase family protein [Anaerolineaceae bacterium]|nr:CDP-glycerol glycerophosphotransferase family protein [Anaerolineaceae bacterium]